MKCRTCGKDNPDGNLFCGSCGESLASYAPSGGAIHGGTTLVKNNLEPGEKILWQGKPLFWPFLLSGFGGIIPGLMFFGFSLFWTLTASSAGAPIEMVLFGGIFMLIGLIILFGGPIVQWMRYNNTEYIVTDRRIITQTGAIGLDTRYIDNEWVREVYVKVGIIDRLYGTGSVMVSTASGMVMGAGPSASRPAMWSLDDPYGVQKIIRDAVKKTHPVHE